MCRSGNLFTFIESWLWQPYGVKEGKEVWSNGDKCLWNVREVSALKEVIDKMRRINNACTGRIGPPDSAVIFEGPNIVKKNPKNSVHVMDHLWLIPSTFHSTQSQQSAGWEGSHSQYDQRGIWRVNKSERVLCQRYVSVTQFWAMDPLAEGCIISSWDTVFCFLAELK